MARAKGTKAKTIDEQIKEAETHLTDLKMRKNQSELIAILKKEGITEPQQLKEKLNA